MNTTYILRTDCQYKVTCETYSIGWQKSEGNKVYSSIDDKNNPKGPLIKNKQTNKWRATRVLQEQKPKIVKSILYRHSEKHK